MSKPIKNKPHEPAILTGDSITPDWADGINRRETPMGVHGVITIPASKKLKEKHQIDAHIREHIKKQHEIHGHLGGARGGVKQESRFLDNGDIEVVFEVHPQWEDI